MRCGRCGAVNPAGARFCGACGAPLEREGLLSPAFLLVTAAALIIAAGGAFLLLLFASPPGPVPLVPIAGREPRLTLIEPHAGRSASVATGVSSDGSVVVGYSFNASGSGPFFWARWDLSAQRAFRWSQDAGITDIGPGSARTWAHAVSADGRWVVGGFYTGARRWHPYRWSAAEGLSDLGTLGIDWADALDVSADGRVVVGASYTPGPSPGWAVYTFRWTPEEGMRALGTLPGYRFSHALGVSADGTIVVGETNRGPAPAWNESEAWIWTPAAGMRGLGVLPPWGSSSARAVSDDGSTVIGLLFNDHDYADWAQYPHRAFRWRADTGMQDLGTLGGERTAVFHALTRDGGMVFGRSQTPSGEWRAFRWTPEKGIEDLNRLYDKAIPSGWVLREVMDCSPDGRYLVGWAEGPGGLLRAFLLDTGGVSP